MLRQLVITAIKTVQDPEIPVNLYDLGLIYDLDLDEEQGIVAITMTLTTPNCPVAESMPGAVKAAVESVPGVEQASVELVWEPPWSRERMSEEARMTLDMMGIDWADGPMIKKGPTGLTVGGKKPPKPTR